MATYAGRATLHWELFFNVLSLRAFPGHVAISGLGSRQQPKKKNTTVEMESRCWGRTMMVGEVEGDRED